MTVILNVVLKRILNKQVAAGDKEGYKTLLCLFIC